MWETANDTLFELLTPPPPSTDLEAEALLPRPMQARVLYAQYRAEGLSPADALDAVRQIWRAIWR